MSPNLFLASQNFHSGFCHHQIEHFRVCDDKIGKAEGWGQETSGQCAGKEMMGAERERKRQFWAVRGMNGNSKK